MSEKTQTTEIPYDTTWKSIEKLANNPWNYGHHQPVGPSVLHVQTAKAALQQLSNAGVPEPNWVFLLNDGTFCAHWRKNGIYASIDFTIDGRFPWVVLHNGRTTHGEMRLNEGLPEALIENLVVQSQHAPSEPES